MARKNSNKHGKANTRRNGISQNNYPKNPKSRLTKEHGDSKIVKFVADQQPKNEKNDIASEEVPLLSGYELPEIYKQLGSLLKYKELFDNGTEKSIGGIREKLKNKDDFKFTPIFYREKHGNYTVTHWCCGVITPNEIYVFDPTLQTQKNKNTEKGMLKIGDTKCEVTYLNHGKQIQSDDGRICGPCIVEFSKKIAELNSIQEVLDACRDDDIFKNVAQEVYNEFICELQGKSLQDKVKDEILGETTYEKLIESQFTKEYYDAIDKAIASQQRANKPTEQLNVQKGEGAANAAFGNVPKNPNKDRIPLFKSLLQLTPVEGTGRIQTPKIEAIEGIRIPIKRSHSVPVITPSHNVSDTKDLKNKGRYRE